MASELDVRSPGRAPASWGTTRQFHEQGTEQAGRLDHVALGARTQGGAVAADRGYGEAAIDDSLHALGITRVVIPRKGRHSQARQAEERQRTFRRHVKWRTGCEGRISHLKRNYGWDRSMIDTTEGARTWTAHGALAPNLTKIAALTA